MKPNRMKQKLRAGEPAYGVSVMIPSPQLVEMLAGLGFDWVLIDCEHGTHSPESVELLAIAADAAGITPIARPARNSPELIGQLLDRGVMGVQVPHVNTAADARRAVEAVKYHPLGRRGLAAGTRSSGYGFGLSVPQYCETANRETLVCVQLEDAAAIDNVDDILTVSGIDVFFIGPSDLSQSMGHVGDPGAAPVADAIEATLTKIVAAGATPGMPAVAENVAALQDKGVRYLYTHVPRLLAAASDAFLSAARAV